jgi:LacI family transcriptional regulator
MRDQQEGSGGAGLGSPSTATKPKTFGLMTDVVLTTPYSFEIVRGLQAEFANRRQTVLIANTDDSSNREAELWNMFASHQVEGVVYASMHHRAHVLGETPFGQKVILVNCYSVGRNYPSILPDDASGGYIQAKHLIQLGHRRIGAVTLIGELPATRLRALGMNRAFAEAGIKLDDTLIAPGFDGPVRNETLIAYDAARKMLSRPDRPTAIICGNDRIAMQVYGAAASLGLSIPQDVSVIGFDNYRLIVETLVPNLTTVALPYYEMGRKAVELINDAAPSIQKISLPCTLYERESCRQIV